MKHAVDISHTQTWATPRSPENAAPFLPISLDNAIRTFRQTYTDVKVEYAKIHELRHEAISRICERRPMQETMPFTDQWKPALLMRRCHPKERTWQGNWLNASAAASMR